MEHYRKWIATPSRRREACHPSADELRQLTARPHLLSVLSEQLPETRAEKAVWYRRSYKLKRYTPLNPTSGTAWLERSPVTSTDSPASKDSSDKDGPSGAAQVPPGTAVTTSNNAWVVRDNDGLAGSDMSLPGQCSCQRSLGHEVNDQTPRWPITPTVHIAASPIPHCVNSHDDTPLPPQEIPNDTEVIVNPSTSSRGPTRYRRRRRNTSPTPPSGEEQNYPPEGSSSRAYNEPSELYGMHEGDPSSSTQHSRDKGKAPADPKLRANYYMRELVYQSRVFLGEMQQTFADLQTVVRDNRSVERHDGQDARMSAADRHRTPIHDEPDTRIIMWGDTQLPEEISRFQEREFMRLALLRVQLRSLHTRLMGVEALCELFQHTAREVFGHARGDTVQSPQSPIELPGHRGSQYGPRSSSSSLVVELPGDSVFDAELSGVSGTGDSRGDSGYVPGLEGSGAFELRGGSYLGVGGAV
ncbi:hypothetical protein OPT61_g10287 [Boeremia exigua]|uniref:Uncharacterized protein n=1 Tax=Boeremia exigua TaxID=749465 RepID=A0ACC2HQE0_9PLEO|nr:hypothetical protein OPT61_g10287 [Boeremia exigua]